MSTASEIVPLFSTPVVISDLPDAAALNAELRKVIEQRQQDASRHAAFQSRRLAIELGHGSLGRRAGDQAAGDRPQPRQPRRRRTAKASRSTVTWRANMWANVNRSGHGNEFHSHPGSFWSGVYYVDDGGIAADPSLGGELEFMDPRGPGPAMYAPHLAFAMPGGLSVGANETVPPKTGRLVMFPAWLLHQVRPYRGGAERISIAFNLSL